MRLLVSNFKGIGETVALEDRDISILTGANSSGKTTIMQAYLLLKQSIESLDRDAALVLNKPYVSLGRFRNILHNNDPKNIPSIGFVLERDDLQFRLKSGRQILHPSLRRYLTTKSSQKLEFIKVVIDFMYSVSKSRVQVKTFMLSVKFDGRVFFMDMKRARTKFDVSTNAPQFFETWFDKEIAKVESYSIRDKGQNDRYGMTNWEQWAETFKTGVEFDTFFPTGFILQDGEKIGRGSQFLSAIRRIIYDKIRKYKYIGPLREAPRPYYFNDDDSIVGIGNKGQYAAHILAKLENKIITIPTLNSHGDFSFKKMKLIDGVRFWLCKYFEMAVNITVDKQSNESFYIIKITNDNGNRIPINQVGFGVSQVLPIIVQGLLLDEDGILILEQPEIHLHPKVQSKLFDFLLCISLEKRRVIVETHSDHLITRMRRRIVEGKIPNPTKDVALYFVEKIDKDLNYRLLSLTEMGSFDEWPKNFFDSQNGDLKAILKAQIIKRKNKLDVNN